MAEEQEHILWFFFCLFEIIYTQKAKQYIGGKRHWKIRKLKSKYSHILDQLNRHSLILDQHNRALNNPIQEFRFHS